MQIVDDRLRSGLTGGQALVRREASDPALDLVERSDPLQRLLGDRSPLALGRIEEAAPDMRPAVSERCRSAFSIGPAELAIGLIAVDLEDAPPVTEQLPDPDAAAAILRIDRTTEMRSSAWWILPARSQALRFDEKRQRKSAPTLWRVKARRLLRLATLSSPKAGWRLRLKPPSYLRMRGSLRTRDKIVEVP